MSFFFAKNRSKITILVNKHENNHFKCLLFKAKYSKSIKIYIDSAYFTKILN